PAPHGESTRDVAGALLIAPRTAPTADGEGSCGPNRGCACRADRSEAPEPDGSNRRTTSPKKTDVGRISTQAAADLADPSPRPSCRPTTPVESRRPFCARRPSVPERSSGRRVDARRGPTGPDAGGEEDGPRRIARIVLPLPAMRGTGASPSASCGGRHPGEGHRVGRRLMDRRGMLGLVGALALAVVTSVAGAAEVKKSADAKKSSCACCPEPCSDCACSAAAKAGAKAECGACCVDGACCASTAKAKPAKAAACCQQEAEAKKVAEVKKAACGCCDGACPACACDAGGKCGDCCADASCCAATKAKDVKPAKADADSCCQKKEAGAKKVAEVKKA
ncbi:hypothetical protein HK102_012549, partial [Quaeritorhiza haematococci]